MEMVRGGLQKKGKEALREAKSSMDELAHKTGQAVTAALDSEPAKALAKVVDESLSQAGEWVEEAETFLAKTGQKISKTIRKYPLEAVAIGFGLGALAVALFKVGKDES